MKKPTVRRGTKALRTKAHRDKTKYRRVDVHEGITYGDWYEQRLTGIGADTSNHKVNPPKEG